MKKFLRGKLALFTVLTGILAIVASFSLSVPAFAANCENVETAIIDCASVNDATGSPVVAVLVLVIQILTGLVGIVAIGAFIYAGIMYSSAGGESSQIAKAKEIMLNTVLGLVIFAAMAVMLNYLIPGGLFSGTAKLGAGGNGLGDQLLKDANRPGAGPGSSGTSTNGRTAVTVASWNSLFSNDTYLATGAKAIANQAQIIGFQEVHWTDSKHRPSLLKDFICSSCKFDGYMDSATRDNSGSKPASLPIAWERSRFTKVSAGYKNVYMESDYAGGAGGSSKWITWVRLKDIKTGDQFYVLNTHTVASVESKGEPSGSAARLSGYKKHMDTLTSLVSGLQKEKIPIILLGDFNVNYRYDVKEKNKSFPYARLGQIGLKSTWNQLNLAGISASASTHGGGSRIIDYVWTWGSSVGVKSAWIGSKYGSDHHAVYSSLTLGAAKTGDSSSASTSLSSVDNFRDLAELNSNLIKKNVVYRSAKLANTNSSDRLKLAKLLSGGVIIDLRTASVRAGSPDQPISSVPNINYAIDAAASASGYVDVFVKDAGERKEFGNAITKIANTDGAVLFHCTRGKDRTGWLASMILYIMGANDQQVMTEYLKSAEAGSGYEVDASWLNAGLSAARKANNGSIMEYITSSKNGLGVSQETITKLKAKLAP